MVEVWKDIPEYEGYYQAASNKIRSLDRIIPDKLLGYREVKGRILKPGLTRRGYLQVSLRKNNQNKQSFVHRLIAKVFIPNPKNLPQVNHKNGIKTDNRIENLEWCTHRENQKHAAENELTAKGKDNGQAKLTEREILEIRRKYIPWKYSQNRLAKEYEVTQGKISYIINNKTWKHLKEEDDFKPVDKNKCRKY